MAKTVQGSEFIEVNWSKQAIESANAFIVSLDEMDKKIIDIAKNLEKLTKLNVGGSAKDIAALNKALAALTKAKKDALTVDEQKTKTEKKIIELENKLAAVTDEQRKKIELLRLEEQRRNREARQSARETLGQVGAFEKLTIKIKELTARYRDMIAAEGQETAESRRLRLEILALNRVRDNANEALGMHQNRVGQYSQAVGKLTQMMGALGLSFGVFQLLRSSMSVIVDFDTALGSLGAISGKTEGELKPLKDQALELGATTQYTASEITNLQIELAKLGFTTDEIMASTGGISKFATATGAGIPEAAALAGSALRAFGLEATEMDRVVSVLGVATTKTGLDFEFLNTAMSTVAPVANAFNFSIEDTTALLGQLANSGFDASSAATATRNILLNLADSNGALAKSLGRPITNVDDLAVGLQELQAIGVDLATALELTDKRSVAAFETFLKGSDSLVELRDSITDVTGELDAMSAKKLDTISGAVDLLKSAWEGLILEWSQGQGIGVKLKDTIKFLADNLGTIIKVVLTGVKAWAAYKIAMVLWRTEVDVINNTTIRRGLIPALLTLGKSLMASVRGFSLSAASIRGFGTALRAIPFAGFLSFLVAVGPMLWDFAKGLFESADSTSALAKATEKANKQIMEEKAEMSSLFEQLKRTNAGSERRKQLIDTINSTYGTTLKNLSDETAWANQLDEAYTRLNKQMEKRIRAQVFQETLTELIKKELEIEQQIDDLIVKRDTRKAIQGDYAQELKVIASYDKSINDLKKSLNSLNAEKTEVFNKINGLDGVQIKALNDRLNDRNKDKTVEGGILKTVKDIKNVVEDIDYMTEDWRDFYTEEIINVENIDDATDSLEKLQDESIKALSLLDKWRIWNLDDNKVAVDAAKKALDQQLKDIESFLKSAAEAKQQALDSEIKNRESEIAASETEISRLQVLGTANAAEAIAAEKDAINKDKVEVEALNKRKRDLLLQVAALELASSKIQQGLSIGGIGGDFKAMFDSLPKFYEGTEGTLGEHFGRTNTKDGRVARFDDGEMVLNGKKVNALRSVGLNTTSDITSAAMRFQTMGLESRAMKGMVNNSFTDQNIVRELRETQKALKAIEPVIYDFDFKQFVETVKKGSMIKRVDHGQNQYKI